MDYKATLNLPRTDFPMRANLPAAGAGDPRSAGTRCGLYERLLAAQRRAPALRAARRPAVRQRPHPPRPHAQQGPEGHHRQVRAPWRAGRAPYVPGWDCHGLPIELAGREAARARARRRRCRRPRSARRCREYAAKFVDIQREEFKRLGVLGDWERPVPHDGLRLRGARRCACSAAASRRGYLYRGKKPVHWCPSCETALAEAEVEYADDDVAVGLRRVSRSSSRCPAPLAGLDGVAAAASGRPRRGRCRRTSRSPCIPTTSTSPSSSAAATLRRRGGAASPRSPRRCGAGEAPRELRALPRRATLEGGRAPPSVARSRSCPSCSPTTSRSRAAPASSTPRPATARTTTRPACATASTCSRRSTTAAASPTRCPSGPGSASSTPTRRSSSTCATAGALARRGELRAQLPALLALQEPDHLPRHRAVVHRHGSRRRPAARAALAEIDRVRWVPHVGPRPHPRHDRDAPRLVHLAPARLGRADRRALLRGAAARALREPRRSCDHVADASSSARAPTPGSRGRSTELRAARARAARRAAARRSGARPTSSTSGSTRACSWRGRGRAARPSSGGRADLYLEGTDQHRGWFHSSLLTGVAVDGPRAVRRRAHARLHARRHRAGRCRSRSATSSRPTTSSSSTAPSCSGCGSRPRTTASDVRISEEILGQLVEAYRRVRNTAPLPARQPVRLRPGARRGAARRAAGARALGAPPHRTRSPSACAPRTRRYEFHVVYHALNNFCSVDLSALYLDVRKDRLYCERADGPGAARRRRRCCTRILDALVRLMAPGPVVHRRGGVELHARRGASRASSSPASPSRPRPGATTRWRRASSGCSPCARAVTKAIEEARQARDGEAGDARRASTLGADGEPRRAARGARSPTCRRSSSSPRSCSTRRRRREPARARPPRRRRARRRAASASAAGSSRPLGADARHPDALRALRGGRRVSRPVRLRLALAGRARRSSSLDQVTKAIVERTHDALRDASRSAAVLLAHLRAQHRRGVRHAVGRAGRPPPAALPAA